MPFSKLTKLGLFNPRKSSRHRIACIALYRALLEHARCIKVPAEYQHGTIPVLKHLIRKQFQRHKFLTSSRLVVAALKVGYETEQTLNLAADGDQQAYAKILEHLNWRRAEADRSKAALRAHREQQIANGIDPDAWKNKIPHRQLIVARPGAKPLLDSYPRTKESLGGRRRIVPKIMNTTGIIFLRVKKPQSMYLSRVIRALLDTKAKRVNRRDALENLAPEALMENVWDEQIRQLRLREGGGGQKSPKQRQRWNQNSKPVPDAVSQIVGAQAIAETLATPTASSSPTSTGSSSSTDDESGGWHIAVYEMWEQLHEALRRDATLTADRLDRLLYIVDEETRLAKLEKNQRRRERIKANKKAKKVAVLAHRSAEEIERDHARQEAENAERETRRIEKHARRAERQAKKKEAAIAAAAAAVVVPPKRVKRK